MFSWIILIVIVVCLTLVGIIVARRLPQAANLDVESLRQEQEGRKKRQLLSQRLEERGRAMRERWAKKTSSVSKWWGKIQLKFRVYVGKVERLWQHEENIRRRRELKEMGPGEREQKLADVSRQAESAFQSGDLDKAEEFYIAAVKMNSRDANAYRGLGDTYLAKEALNEAWETFNFLRRLAPTDDYALIRLGDIAEKQGKVDMAIQYYQQATLLNDSLSPRFYHLAELLLKIGQPAVAVEAVRHAVELEPKNPKYLDLLIETAIICDDKLLAEKSFEELRLVNSDNNKLVDFKERISKL